MCPFTNAAVSFGPTNITRRIGEDDIVFVCPSVDHKRTPIWKVNGLTHATSDLPRPFVPVYDNLLIPFVQQNMDGFTFQCFIPNGKGVVPSSIGTLHVALLVNSDNVLRPNVIKFDNLEPHQDITPLQQVEVSSTLNFDNSRFEFNRRTCKLS